MATTPFFPRPGRADDPLIVGGRSARRRYHSWRQLRRDLSFLVRHWRSGLGVLRRHHLAADFRERLMLVVTAVNRCRACASVHSLAALRAGVGEDEVAGLLSGNLRQAPADQLPALLYAQHWAERDAVPEPQARVALGEVYPAQVVESIEVALHAIRIGNLAGNTFAAAVRRIAPSAIRGEE